MRTRHGCFGGIFLDVDRTRRQGRRVKKGLAVKEPQLVNVIKAVEKLGLGWKVEDGKSYPGAWWNKQGMCLLRTIWPRPNC